MLKNLQTLVPILLAFATSISGDCTINGKSYKTDETAPEGKIVFQCVEGGRIPIGIVKSDRAHCRR